MMNGVVQAEHHKLHRGPLEHSAKIQDLHQLLAGQFSGRFEIFRVTLLIPRCNFSGCLDVFGNHRRIRVQHAVDHCFDKAIVRRGNVPRQLDRTS